MASGLHFTAGLITGKFIPTLVRWQFRSTAWATGTDLSILLLITALSRFAFRSRFLYDLDSVNFALALTRFDPSVHQPHPPGYFLYILLGRLVNRLARDANGALVGISIAASCGAAAMIYLLTHDWFGSRAARCASAMVVFSPLAWFHGTVALTYSVEMFFSSLTGYLCWNRYVRSSAAVLGLAAGFRPSSFLFLAPLFFFALWKEPWRLRLTGVAILLLVMLAWFIPMVRESGGFAAWSGSLSSLWSTVPGRGTIFNSSIANSAARFFSILLIGLLCFGCAALLPFLRRRQALPLVHKAMLFTCVWIAPGLLFFTFVFLKFVNSGYLLLLSPPLFAWLGFFTPECFTRGRKALACAALAANVLIFLFAPLYCSYGEVRAFERQLRSVLASLPGIASPSDTVIVGFDSHFMGYRHAGYYFPDYVTIEYPPVRVSAGPRIFTMRHRDTTLAESLPVGVSKFLIFPLPPEDAENRDYMLTVLNKLDPAKLRFVKGGGNLYVTGPVSALPALFHVDP